MTLNTLLAAGNAAALAYLDDLDDFLRGAESESPEAPLDEEAQTLIINAMALKLRLASLNQ